MIRVGVDVGGTFTDLVALDGRALVTRRRCPRTPDDQSEGVMRALEAIDGSASVDRLRARHDGRHERAARAPRRAHGARHHRGLPRRDRDRPPGPPVALRPDRAPARRRSCRASCASGARADGPGRASSSRSTRTACERPSTRCARPRSRPSRSACCSRSCTPSTSARVGEALREALPGRPRLAVERGAAGVPRVRALLDHGRRRLPRARLARLPRAAGGRAPSEAGVPAPLVMQSSGGVVDARRRRRRPAAGCVLSGPAGGVVGAAHVARGRAASRTC